MENIFLSDEDYEQLASQTEDLIAKVDDLPYPKVKDDIDTATSFQYKQRRID